LLESPEENGRGFCSEIMSVNVRENDYSIKFNGGDRDFIKV
jgi:hypothetical protein